MGSSATRPAPTVRPHEALVHAVLFASPLAIATVHPPVVLGFCSAVLVAFVLFIGSGGSLPAWRPARLLSFVLLAGAVIILLQLVPLPRSVAAVLSPKAVAVTDALKAHLGIDAPLTISLDPPGTFLEGLKWCAGLMGFIIVAGLDAAGRRRVLRTIAWAGFSVMVVGIAQKLAGVEAILGFYQPTATLRGFFVSTFVNENHLAGFLGLCSCVAFGLGLEEKERPRRWLYLFIATVTGVGVFLSLSRGGIVAFLAAQLFLLFLLAQRRVRLLSRTAWWHLLVVAVIGVASWLAYAELAHEWATMSTVEKVESDGKLKHFGDAARMAAAYWPVGVGRGAYIRAIDAFRSPGVQGAWSHVENEYLQIAVDMGLPYALLFFGALLAYCVAAFFSRRGSALDAGLLAGVYMLALHNAVDYNLEVASVALAMLAVLGAMGAGETSPPPATPRRPTLLFLMLGLGAIAAAGAASNVRHEVVKDTERIRDLLLKDGYHARAKEVARVISTHRADYFTPHLVAVSLLTRMPYDPALAEKFLLHATYLNPAGFEPHLFMARLNWWMGDHEGALAQYKDTIRLHPPVAAELLPEIARRAPALAPMMSAVPVDPGPMLALGGFLWGQGRSADAITVYRALLKRHPADRDGITSLARALTATGQLEEARSLVQGLISREPSGTEGYKLLAGIEQKAGRPREAFALYRKVLTLDRFDTGALINIASYQMGEKSYAEARRTVRDIFLAQNVDNGTRVQAHMMLAAIGEAEGRRVEALSEYRHVRDLSPEYTGALWGIARMHEALLEPAKAMETYRDILRLTPADKGAEARLKALQDRQKGDLEKAKREEYMK